MARFLALDWDQQLHIVAADVRGGSVTFRRAVVSHEAKQPNPAEAEELGQQLKQRLKEAGIAPAPVIVCVGRDRVVLKEVRYPAVPESEEPAIVRFQAVKELTDSLDDIVLDYAPLGETGSERRALIFSVRRELLTTYQKLCQAAGLKLVGMTARPLGLAAAVTAFVPPDEAVAVVGSGEGWAEFCIVRGGKLLLARSLNPGTGLASEIRRNISVFSGHSVGQEVTGVYVAGMEDDPLVRRLSATLDLPVHPFDPFAGAPADAAPAGERGSFVAATGILAAQAKGRLPVNFVNPRQPAPPKRFDAKRIAVAATLAVIVLGGTTAYCRSLYLDTLQEKAAKEEERDDLEQKLTATKETSRRAQALDSWESPIWLDELYELAATATDLENLRITSISAVPMARNTTPNAPKSRFTAQVNITGTLFREGRAPLDRFIAELAKDSHYSPQAPKVADKTFSLTINVERRPPGEYTRKIAKGGAGR